VTYELKISFTGDDFAQRSEVKIELTDTLRSLGRNDFVEGYIDGVEMELLPSELALEPISEQRFNDAPVLIYDEHREAMVHLAESIAAKFGRRVELVISDILDASWQSCWTTVFSPFETTRFFIVPSGSEIKTPIGLERIEIDTGDGAFGTGQHATTRAVMRTLEQFVPVWKPESLLDVGTGTGIYLLLAGKLGVGRLLGTEISNELRDVALGNCRRSGVSAEVHVTEAVSFEASFDLVIANILVPVLHDLLGQMVERMSHRGRLVLAGFVAKEEGPIITKAKTLGLGVIHRCEDNGWVCLVLTR
jgi:ribosomal protein L11 methyltransferase